MKVCILKKSENGIEIQSDNSNAKGFIQSLDKEIDAITETDSTYTITLRKFSIAPNESKTINLAHTFIFPEYDLTTEMEATNHLPKVANKVLQERIVEKTNQLQSIQKKTTAPWKDSIYSRVYQKSILTLQNNWKVAAGELKHEGCFPSYHYLWFNGFWAWDSWKHAAAITQYQPELAKNQVRAMFDFQDKNGFVADCVYRDTTIEKHNYRDTKPPLAAWAVWNIYEATQDATFLKEIYPNLTNYHQWWYQNRDHDKDGICEYGSTDGTLIAAKWESGMDNAVRYDDTKLVKNSETAWSMDQESVDLNSYLYAEKNYLANIARVLKLEKDEKQFHAEAIELKEKIQKQFFDKESGWFYDTNLEGSKFIKAMGCEGWIPLWANAASKNQAEAIAKNMALPETFNTKIPFQTLAANHPKFEPNGGYWRGPNWLDQAYFGVKGLRNYGFEDQANKATYKLIHNAEGLLEKGPSIRENYQPITGAGLESENFSWSAAHYLLLLTKN